MSNFTVIDLSGSLLGVILFAPLMTTPGYLAAWFSDALGFRKLPVHWRVSISVPLSVAISPIISYWLGSVFGWPGVWGLYGLAAILSVLLLCGVFGHESARAWFSQAASAPRFAYVVAGIWLLVAVLSLVDIQIGERLYFSATVYDHSVRTAITDAITRTGVRPANPFYDLGSLAPLRYHYFWFIACSLVDQLGGRIVDARQAIIASVVWSGWAFTAAIPLFLRFVFNLSGSTLRRTTKAALALTLVTGLDILPTIFGWFHGIVYADMEWWNFSQITSWWDTGLWVPHHLAGLTSGLIGLLLLWHAASQPHGQKKIAETILAGIAFSTMVGTSIYVAFVIAVFLALWTALVLFLREWDHALVLSIAGAVTFALVLPYALSISHLGSASAGHGASVSLFKPSIRHFSPLDAWLARRQLSDITGKLITLLALPLNYFLELGFFLVAALVYVREKRKTGCWSMSLNFTALLAASSFVICSTLRSAVISNNDLGSRGFLPAQFVFLLWTAELLCSRKEVRSAARQPSTWSFHPAWAVLIVLGLAGTIYQVGYLRLVGPLADHGIAPLNYSPDRQLGRRAYALRSAYRNLNRVIPRWAIVQNNPQWKYSDFFYGLYAHRQTAAYDPDCGAEFGGSQSECHIAFPQLASAFSESSDTTGDIARLFRTFNIRAVIVKDLDGAWKDRETWVWRTSPALANDYVRIYLVPENLKQTSAATTESTAEAAQANVTAEYQ